MAAEFGRFVAATLLLASALLKYLVPDYTSAEFFSISQPEWYWALCAFELVLGLLLLLRAMSGLEAYVAIATFSLFVAVQAYFAISGDRACGCLGALSIPARIMLAIDVVVLGLLVVYVLVQRPRQSVRWLRLLVAMGLSSGALLLFNRTTAAEKADLLARISGRSFYATTPFIDLGELEAETKTVVPVTVANLTDEPIDVVGATISPIVDVLGDLPSIPPDGGTGTMKLSLIVRGTVGERKVKMVTLFAAANGKLATTQVVLAWVPVHKH